MHSHSLTHALTHALINELLDSHKATVCIYDFTTLFFKKKSKTVCILSSTFNIQIVFGRCRCFFVNGIDPFCWKIRMVVGFSLHNFYALTHELCGCDDRKSQLLEFYFDKN